MSQLFINLSVWHWLAGGFALLIIEILLNSGFLIWIAAAAAIVGIITLLIPALSSFHQLLLFGVLAVLSLMISQFYFRKKIAPSNAKVLNRRSEQYIGRVFILNEPIVNGFGHIKVDDTVWRIRGKDFAAGTKIKVTSVEGVFLVVEEAD